MWWLSGQHGFDSSLWRVFFPFCRFCQCKVPKSQKINKKKLKGFLSESQLMHPHTLKQFIYETLCNYRKWHASLQKKALPFSPFHTVILIFDESWILWLRWKYGWINLSGIKDASECAFVLVRYSRDDSCIRHELRDSLTERLWKGMVMEESFLSPAWGLFFFSLFKLSFCHIQIGFRFKCKETLTAKLDSVWGRLIECKTGMLMHRYAHFRLCWFAITFLSNWMYDFQ